MAGCGAQSCVSSPFRITEHRATLCRWIRPFHLHIFPASLRSNKLASCSDVDLSAEPDNLRQTRSLSLYLTNQLQTPPSHLRTHINASLVKNKSHFHANIESRQGLNWAGTPRCAVPAFLNTSRVYWHSLTPSRRYAKRWLIFALFARKMKINTRCLWSMFKSPPQKWALYAMTVSFCLSVRLFVCLSVASNTYYCWWPGLIGRTYLFTYCVRPCDRSK